MLRLAALVLAALTLGAAPAEAQRPVAVRAPSDGVIRPAPARSGLAIRAGAPPRPLSEADRRAYLTGARPTQPGMRPTDPGVRPPRDRGRIAAAPRPVVTHLRLTPRRPHTVSGALRFDGPFLVDSGDDYATVFYTYPWPVQNLPDGTPRPGIWTTVDLVGGERYLLDYAVRMSAPDQGVRVMSLSGGGAPVVHLEQALGPGAHHVVALVEPTASGRHVFFLAPFSAGQAGADLTFYAVEISRLD